MFWGMQLVNEIKDIIENMNTIDLYIERKKDPEYSYALQLIKRGTCFVKYNGKFYPSRFVGYKNNTMEKHDNNTKKDGRITNPAISRLIGGLKPQHNKELDIEYKNYCEALGFIAKENGSFGVERKYWVL